MARNKPDMSQVWADQGDKINPNTQYSDANKIETGWIEELPFHESANFIANRQDQFNAHINDYGIVQWDSSTVYPVGAWIASTLNSNKYEAVQEVPANQGDPSLDNGSYWKVLSSSRAISYIIETGSNANGYYRLWSDGYIEQWGDCFKGQQRTFPTSYSNSGSIRVLIEIAPNASGDNERESYPIQITNNSFTLGNFGGVNNYVYYSVGY